MLAHDNADTSGKAIVIFPPGEKSLEDIRYMLGMGKEDDDGCVDTMLVI
jgi:hypothetical protein